MKVMRTDKTPFSQTVLAVAVAVALVPGQSEAGLKVANITGLPQTGTITGIRSGKAGNGNIVISWLSDRNVYAQRLFSTGSLDGDMLNIAADVTTAAGLAVKANGSFISAWPTSSTIQAMLVTGNTLAPPFSVAAQSIDTPVQALAQTNGFQISWAASLLAFDENAQPVALQVIDGFDSIAMDSDGDFFVAKAETDSVTVNKNNAQTLTIAASQAVNSYDFDNGKNKNKSVSFSVADPIIAANSSGDFVVVWQEVKTETFRKRKQSSCYTDEYGYKTCDESFTYTSSPATALVARRYSNTLQPKEVKALQVASTRGPGKYLADTSVVMDTDGDFTVAYVAGKSASDSAGYNSSDESEVFARQFAMKNNKLTAGSAIQVSGKPKLAGKHSVKNSTNREPSVVVTDENKNAFMIVWHNDYEDHYKDYEDKVEVCAKFKTVKYDGYSSKECVRYKLVPNDVSASASLLKAKRYSK